MSEPRAALLIATSRYDDPSLPPLEGARTDVDGFAEVLGDPHIGGFDVHTVIDREAHEVAADMETFLQERQRNELILVYITGHGVKGMDGRLTSPRATPTASGCDRLRWRRRGSVKRSMPVDRAASCFCSTAATAVRSSVA